MNKRYTALKNILLTLFLVGVILLVLFSRKTFACDPSIDPDCDPDPCPGGVCPPTPPEPPTDYEPTIQSITLLNQKCAQPNSNISIRVIANDDHGVKKIYLYRGAVLVATYKCPPNYGYCEHIFSVQACSNLCANCVFKARAQDNKNQYSNYKTLDVYIDNPPTVSIVSNASIVNINEHFTLLANATDSCISNLTIQIINKTLQHTCYNDLTCAILALTSETIPGNYTYTARVVDNCNWSSNSSTTVQVIRTNIPPVAILHANVIHGYAPLSVLFDSSYSYDPDGIIVEYCIDYNDSAGYCQNTPIVEWHNFSMPGIYNVSLRVRDNDNATDYDYVTIIVETRNTCPTFNHTLNFTAYEGQNIIINFSNYVYDAEGNFLFFSYSNLPSGVMTNNEIFNWTPNYEQEGDYSFNIFVSDGFCNVSGAVDVRVIDVNRIPFVENVSVLPDSPVTSHDLLCVYDFVDFDGDVDLSFVRWYRNGVLLNYTGVLLPSSFTGKGDVFVCEVLPFDGKDYGIPVNSSAKIIGNTCPEFIEDLDFVVNEGQTLLVNLSLFASDADNDLLHFSGTGIPEGASLNDSGLFVWTPNYEQSGNYTSIIYVYDSSCYDNVEMRIRVIDVLNYSLNTSIDCFDKVVVHHNQSCSVFVRDNFGNLVGNANVNIYFLNGSLFGSCITNHISGGCSVLREMNFVGNYTVYPTAYKTGYVNDTDTYPRFDFEVIPQRYDIFDLVVYNDSLFTNPDDVFYRGENMYVKFRAYDYLTESFVQGAVTEVALVSPPGGIANLTKIAESGSWYYYKLEPIPPNHNFLGNSQVFAFVFNFSDNTGGEKQVNVTILNNPPIITPEIPNVYTDEVTPVTINLALHEFDVEDSGTNLTWQIMNYSNSLFNYNLVGKTLSINPLTFGNGFITLRLYDLDLDYDEQTVMVYVSRQDLPPTLEAYYPIVVSPGESATIRLRANDDFDVKKIYLYNQSMGLIGIYECVGIQTTCEHNFSVSILGPDCSSKEFYAKAEDNSSQYSILLPITINIDSLPQVTITTNNSHPRINESFRLFVNATDNCGLSRLNITREGINLQTKNCNGANYCFDYLITSESFGGSFVYCGIAKDTSSRTSTSCLAIEINTTPLNNIPFVENVSVLPDSPVTSHDLLCVYDFVDFDGDVDLSFVRWYRNGVLLNYTGVLLPSSFTGKGDVFVCEVLPFDGKDYGIPVNSSAVAIGNSCPVVHLAENYTVVEGELLEIIINATDPDNDNLTYAVSYAPSNSNLTGNIFTWRPSFTQSGAYHVTFTVSDSYCYVGQGVVIFVSESGNHNPYFISTPITTGVVEETYVYDSNAVDPDNDTLIYSLVEFPINMTINPTTGVITWVPKTTGSFKVTIRAEDGKGGYALQSYSISVEPKEEIKLPRRKVFVEQLSIINEDCIEPGDDLYAFVNFKNMGFYDMRNVRITAVIQELGVRQRLGPFKLEPKEEIAKILITKIPEDASEGTYYVRFTINDDMVKRVIYRDIMIRNDCKQVCCTN
ncbi:MAG: putative Ig domain-containing protein [Candidatus Woesearchaeota archaeon]